MRSWAAGVGCKNRWLHSGADALHPHLTPLCYHCSLVCLFGLSIREGAPCAVLTQQSGPMALAVLLTLKNGALLWWVGPGGG
jgi:hypothetical protein